MNISLDPLARAWLMERGGKLTISPPSSRG